MLRGTGSAQGPGLPHAGPRPTAVPALSVPVWWAVCRARWQPSATTGLPHPSHPPTRRPRNPHGSWIPSSLFRGRLRQRAGGRAERSLPGRVRRGGACVRSRQTRTLFRLVIRPGPQVWRGAAPGGGTRPACRARPTCKPQLWRTCPGLSCWDQGGFFRWAGGSGQVAPPRTRREWAGLPAQTRLSPKVLARRFLPNSLPLSVCSFRAGTLP